MKCLNCGHEMTVGRENHRYTECGLDDVTLVGVEVRSCPNCGERELNLKKLPELHRVIAQALVSKDQRLAAKEIRFLRKYVGFSGADFARRLGTSPETLSKWENGKQQMGWPFEFALRMMVLYLGRVSDYPLERFEGLSKKTDRSPARIRVREEKRRWESEPMVALA